jgi:hypothetical protein
VWSNDVSPKWSRNPVAADSNTSTDSAYLCIVSYLHAFE